MEAFRPPKQMGRIRGTLRATVDLVNRRLTARPVVVVTILLLAASWIYPPWIVGSGRGVSHGWYFVFDTTREIMMRVDFGRLLLINAIIAAAGGLLAWAAFHNSKALRKAIHITVYSLLAAPLIAILCLGVFLVQRQVAKKDAKRSAITFLEEPAANSGPWPGTPMPKSEYDALLTAIPPDDLKKITLFDVGPYVGKYPGIFVEPTNLGGFHGRIRNGLSRVIERVGIKASFFDAAGGLIEVRTFWMKDATGVERFFPNTPVSFDSYVLVKHLPSGWRYQLEVTEAHYVQDIFDKIVK
jgi:hypothetical protein